MQRELSVVVPVYNEEAKISQTLVEIIGRLSRDHDYEIIVVNDGSTDSSPKIVADLAAKNPRIRFIDRKENRGKGQTVKQGIDLATKRLCLFMDADNATTIAEWDKFLPYFDEGFHCVSASRHLHGSKIVHPQPFMRRFLGTGYRNLCRFLFGLKLSDLNCGFKAYETRLAKEVYKNVHMTDWTFDVEVFCLLKRKNVQIAEVPVRWVHCEKPSNLAPVSTAIKSLCSVFRLYFRFLKK